MAYVLGFGSQAVLVQIPVLLHIINHDLGK